MLYRICLTALSKIQRCELSDGGSAVFFPTAWLSILDVCCFYAVTCVSQQRETHESMKGILRFSSGEAAP